jgi:hypothetical protein
LVVVFGASVLLSLVSLLYLPPEVAIHFGAKGNPDSWGTRELLVWFFLAMDLGLLLMFLLIPSLLLRMPVSLISLPNRDYWLAEENRPKFKSIFEGLWWEYGAAVLLFSLLMKALTIDANLSAPAQMNSGVFWVLFIAFMSYTLYWVIRISRAFSVAKSAQN